MTKDHVDHDEDEDEADDDDDVAIDNRQADSVEKDARQR